MVRQLTLIALLATIALMAPVGCASSQKTGPQATQRFGPADVTTETVSAMLLGFADDHVLRIIEAVDNLEDETTSLAERARLNDVSLKNAQASFSIASGSNPIVGMTDMVVMVSLSREAVRRSAIDSTLTRAQRDDPASYEMPIDEVKSHADQEERLLYRAFTRSEEEIRKLAELVFWPEQMKQLDALIAEWWSRNPARRLVFNVRLQDFAGYRAATVETMTSGPRNLLGLLYLDPLASMDPTTREIAQSRMLAERVTYQINRLPMIASMHAQGLVLDSLMTSELTEVREALTGTQEAAAQFADAVDRWPDEVSAEREAAIEQLQTVMAAERDAAMTQLAEFVETEREAAIADVEAAVARQREELLATIEERAGAIQDTLSQLGTTLASANTLSSSVNEAVSAIDGMEVDNFQRLVDSTNESVAGVERTVDTVERLLASERIDATADNLDSRVTSATASSRELVDYLFQRGLLFAAIVLVGWVFAALVIKMIGAKIAGRS